MVKTVKAYGIIEAVIFYSLSAYTGCPLKKVLLLIEFLVRIRTRRSIKRDTI